MKQAKNCFKGVRIGSKNVALILFHSMIQVLQVVLCQINILCHQLIQNTTKGLHKLFLVWQILNFKTSSRHILG